MISNTNMTIAGPKLQTIFKTISRIHEVISFEFLKGIYVIVIIFQTENIIYIVSLLSLPSSFKENNNNTCIYILMTMQCDFSTRRFNQVVYQLKITINKKSRTLEYYTHKVPVCFATQNNFFFI